MYIIIPNLNGAEHLKTCYRSLKSQTVREFKLILVDNNSSDDSVDLTLSELPDAEIIRLEKNHGFAGAVNKGLAFAISDNRYESVLLLNNDIELTPDFIEKGLKTFQQHPDAYMIAVKMLNYYNRNIIDDCGDFIKALGGSPFARGHGEEDRGQYDKTEYIFGACAGAAFYRLILFREIGYFDEIFFAYYEDIDISFRAQLAGYKCIYQPEAVCYHKRGGTASAGATGFQTEMCERNLVLMRFKNYPLSIYVLYQPLFLIARIKRYYGFIKYNSPEVFIKALRGYIRGIALLPFMIKSRFRIQKNIRVNSEYIKNLFHT